MSRSARAAAVTLLLIAAACLAGPALFTTDPVVIGDVLALRLVPPLHRDALGALHVLGTDAFGRDLLARILLAGRVSLVVGLAGAVLASLFGTALGAVAAHAGGAADTVVMAAADALLAVPRLVLLLAISALWPPGLATVVVVLAVTGWMGVARLVRADVLVARRLPYADAAVALGATRTRLLWRHLLPNALAPAVVATTLGVGNAIALESGLSFLGLGIQPPRPSWGNLVSGGRELIVTAPWVAIAPGIAVVVTVVALTIVGDAVGDRLGGRGRM